MGKTKQKRSNEYQLKADQAIKVLMEQFKLTGEETSKFRTYLDLTRLNSELDSKSQKQYNIHYEGLKRFCAITGEYDSLLILQPFANDKCPPLSANVVSNYIKYRREKKGTVIEGMFDVITKQPIKAIAGWNDPGNVGQLKTAVMNLHRHMGHGECSYQTVCDDCLLDHQNQSANGRITIGCSRHLYKPRLYRVGNPFTDSECRAAVKKSKKDGETYVPCENDLISPFEIDTLADHLIGTNKLENYQLWVMILISIKLFLRGSETCGFERVKKRGGQTEIKFTGIRQESFDWSFSTFKNDEFETFALRIKGIAP